MGTFSTNVFLFPVLQIDSSLMSTRASSKRENTLKQKNVTSWLRRHFGFYCVFSCSLDWHRRDHERGSGLVLHCVHLDLCCCRHYLHAAGWPLFCSIHRCSPAHPHICWLGECNNLRCSFQVKEEEVFAQNTRMKVWKSSVFAVDLRSLCADESSHRGHQPDHDEQHLARSLDWSARAKKDLATDRSLFALCTVCILLSLSL